MSVVKVRPRMDVYCVWVTLTSVASFTFHPLERHLDKNTDSRLIINQLKLLVMPSHYCVAICIKRYVSYTVFLKTYYSVHFAGKF